MRVFFCFFPLSKFTTLSHISKIDRHLSKGPSSDRVIMSTIVVKLGSSSIVSESREPRIANISLLVSTLVNLRRQGHRVVLVSSGAIAMGLNETSLERKPKKLAAKQALAALGQGKLISLWDNLFKYYNQKTAQILLTRNDISEYSHFRNAENTLQELLSMDVIPIVNENDTISTQEIKFGDNDQLSAITAGMVNADYLFLLTDVDCLYTDNPKTNPDARKVLVVRDMNDLHVNTKSGAGSAVGTGGMETKILAADLATNAGITTIICHSNHPEQIEKMINHEPTNEPDYERANIEEESRLKEMEIPLHTRFIGHSKSHIKDREFWLLHGLKPKGSLIVDYGCFQAITRVNRAGLLPVGIIGVEGHFNQLECVELRLGFKGVGRSVCFGRGRCNYNSSEIEKIKGVQSSRVGELLGYWDSEYVVHRDNMAVKLDNELEEFIKENT